MFSDVARSKRAYPGKFVLLSFFLLSGSGCNLLQPGYYYYYQPSIADRALNTNIELNQEDKGSKINGINVTDVDVFAFLQDVKQAWRQRSQASRVGGALGGVSSVGLAAAATTAAATHGGTTAGNTVPILTGIGTFIGELLGLVNPSGRDEAYKDGLKLLLEAEAEYCQTLVKLGDCKADGTKMTEAGAMLLQRTNAAIVVVDKALEGRVPTREQIDAATARLKTTLDTSIEVMPASLSLRPSNSASITVVHGDHVRATSGNNSIAEIQETEGSNGTKFDVTAKASDCQSTTMTLSNGTGGKETVVVRIEPDAGFELSALSSNSISRSAPQATATVVKGCPIKNARSNDPRVEVSLAGDGSTVTLTLQNEAKVDKKTPVRISLTNQSGRSLDVPVTLDVSP
jgi:hypothetical protein